MKKWILFLILSFVLTACGSSGLSPTALPSKVDSAASSGAAGLSKVEVSDGVVLLTPGQDDLAALPAKGNTFPSGFVTATPTATVNPVNVEMPEGIPLYPGATDLKVPTSEELSLLAGMSGNYVIFYTTDSNDQLVSFYTEKAAAGGWSVMDTQTEPDYDGSITQIWGKDNKLLLLQTWAPVDGMMKVQISWR